MEGDSKVRFLLYDCWSGVRDGGCGTEHRCFSTHSLSVCFSQVISDCRRINPEPFNELASENQDLGSS